MALFQRRKRDDDGGKPKVPKPDTRSGVAASEVPPEETPPAPTPPAPTVNIEVSAFRGLGAPAGPAVNAADVDLTTPAVPEPDVVKQVLPAAEASTVHETVPGVRDNVLLRDALAALGDGPSGAELLNVLRQLMQGHVFLRVPGDARELFAKGEPMPMAVVTSAQGQRFVMLYSSGRALNQAARQGDNLGTTAVAQPVVHALRAVLAGEFDGVIIDHASSPARAILPRALLQKALDEADPNGTIKSLLIAQRTADTADDVVRAMRAAPLWVAIKNTTGDTPGGPERMGIAEARTEAGERFIEVFSHPLEVAALGRGDRAMRYPASQLARSLRDHPELSGVLVDSAGPWIQLGRAALAPLLSLADGPSA